MKKLNKNQIIAVFAGLAFVAFLFYGDTLMNYFNTGGNNVGSNDSAREEVPSTGVEVREVVVGEGEVASPGDTVTVHYVGVLTNGKVFDSSLDRGAPFSFTLGVGQVIRGWDEGVVGMQVGGKRHLIIAPDYAYGERAVGPIPANSTLVFDVELISVEKADLNQ